MEINDEAGVIPPSSISESGTYYYSGERGGGEEERHLLLLLILEAEGTQTSSVSAPLKKGGERENTAAFFPLPSTMPF